jgi:phenylalanyl-tRNA synthetase beta chain
VLGVDLPISRVRGVLRSLGFSCRWVSPDRYVVGVPYWRTDVHIPDDVVEEVARIVGYDQLPIRSLGGEVPAAVPQPLRELRERCRDLLAAAGMQEVITYSLLTQEALERVLSPEDLAAHPPLRVANPMSAEMEYLRTSLRASLLQALAANLRHGEGGVAIFEAARVYLRRDDELPDERECVAAVISGRREDRWGHPSEDSVDFYDAKGYLEQLLNGLGVEAILAEAESFALVPGRTAEVRIGDRVVGVLGQVHPRVTAAFDIAQDVYLFEVVLDEVLPLVGGPRHYESIPRFPPVVQDIAVVVEEGVPAGRVQAIIEQARLVGRVRLFDVYTGEQVAKGKKSLAFSVAYQSPDHTLTDEEVARGQRGILERLKREVEATLRG